MSPGSSAACLLAGYPAEKEGGKATTAYPLTVTISRPAETLTDFKHWLRTHGGGSVYNLCLHSHEYSSLTLAVIFVQ